MGMKHKLGKIGILMGGPSAEREVSFKSGKAVYFALGQLGLEIEAIDIKTDDPKKNKRLIKSRKIECAFLALHGRFGEDGSIQEILEAIKIPYTGSGVLASRLAMDKIASRRIFELHGLKVPRYKVLNKASRGIARKVCADFGFPLVIKPAAGGSSIGLSIINKAKELDKAIESAFSFDEKIIIEQYVKGRELTVGILEERALPVIEIIPKNRFFDYEAKYHAGLTDYIVPAKLKESLVKKAKEAALSAHRLLGCFGCSRVDIILDEGNLLYVLEVNTIPGLTSTSLLPKAAGAVGIPFEELCLRLIKLAYEKK